MDAVLRIPLDTRGVSLLQLFEEAEPDLSVPVAFRNAAIVRLNADPALLDAWQTYSWDKRSSPSPYLEGLEVGHYDGGRRDRYVHPDAASACADFIFREASWILSEERVGPPA